MQLKTAPAPWKSATILISTLQPTNKVNSRQKAFLTKNTWPCWSPYHDTNFSHAVFGNREYSISLLRFSFNVEESSTKAFQLISELSTTNDKVQQEITHSNNQIWSVVSLPLIPSSLSISHACSCTSAGLVSNSIHFFAEPGWMHNCNSVDMPSRFPLVYALNLAGVV